MCIGFEWSPVCGIFNYFALSYPPSLYIPWFILQPQFFFFKMLGLYRLSLAHSLSLCHSHSLVLSHSFTLNHSLPSVHYVPLIHDWSSRSLTPPQPSPMPMPHAFHQADSPWPEAPRGHFPWTAAPPAALPHSPGIHVSLTRDGDHGIHISVSVKGVMMMMMVILDNTRLATLVHCNNIS